VIAKGGDDTICTWQGPDVPDGGPDDDLIFGGSQADRMFGKEGHDHLLGEAGQDRLDGGHTPVPSSLPDTQPDICDGGLHQDRFFLCETIIDPPDLPKS
jgi:Ca2+-binding RTX toxin-like protein